MNEVKQTGGYEMIWSQLLGCGVVGIAMMIAMICLETGYFDREYTPICVTLYSIAIATGTALITGAAP